MIQLVLSIETADVFPGGVLPPGALRKAHHPRRHGRVTLPLATHRLAAAYQEKEESPSSRLSKISRTPISCVILSNSPTRGESRTNPILAWALVAAL